MEKQLKQFFEFLENEKKLSNNTLQSYKRDIRQFREYLESRKINYNKASEKTMNEYIEHLQKEGKKASTISRCIASIRSFYQYELKNKKVKKDPTEKIQSPKIEKKAPSTLTFKEVSLLLEQPKGVDLKGIRDKAMLEFAYATGMRVTEIISLNIQDVNLEDGFVICRSGKKERHIPLGKMSLKALSDYIEKSRNILIKDENVEALFVNINGKRLTRPSTYNKRYNATYIKTFICNTFIAKWCRFEGNSINVRSFRYIFNTGIYAISR